MPLWQQPMIRTLLALVLFFAPTGIAGAEKLSVNPSSSSIRFSVSHLGVFRVKGRFKTFSGNVDYDPNDAARSTVSISIRTDSVDTGNADRDRHLRSADFFDAARFPLMLYAGRSIAPRGGEYMMDGLLTINGIQKPVPVFFTLTIAKSRGGTRFRARGHASVSRGDFKFGQVGGLLIGDEVKIDLSIQN